MEVRGDGKAPAHNLGPSYREFVWFKLALCDNTVYCLCTYTPSRGQLRVGYKMASTCTLIA